MNQTQNQIFQTSPAPQANPAANPQALLEAIDHKIETMIASLSGESLSLVYGHIPYDDSGDLQSWLTTTTEGKAAAELRTDARYVLWAFMKQPGLLPSDKTTHNALLEIIELCRLEAKAKAIAQKTKP